MAPLWSHCLPSLPQWWSPCPSCSSVAPTSAAPLQAAGRASSGTHVLLSLSQLGYLPVLCSLNMAISAEKVPEYSWEQPRQQPRAGANLQWQGDDRQPGQARASSLCHQHSWHCRATNTSVSEKHLIPTVLLFLIMCSEYVIFNLCSEKFLRWRWNSYYYGSVSQYT